jgi:transcriptional regulator with XRE-family HTH domain
VGQAVPGRAIVGVIFGMTLRRLRNRKGTSQERLARDASFDKTYTSLLERGLRTPSLPVLMRVAAHLGIKASHLVFEFEKQLRRFNASGMSLERYVRKQRYRPSFKSNSKAARRLRSTK